MDWNLYGQAEGPVVPPILRLLWTKLGVAVSHEIRLEDVATAAILPEQPIVQIHFQTSCLEVQGHFGKRK